MNIPSTFNSYLCRKFSINLFFALLLLLGIIYILDTVELIRRASGRSDNDLSLALTMGLLKLPEVGQVILPFAVLFSSIYTFWQLNRSYELVVARSSGMSIWQFLIPVAGLAFVLGVFAITVINPLGSIFLSKYDEMERVHLIREPKLISIFQSGLWLRQKTDDGYVIMHADHVNPKTWQLQDTMALFFENNDVFVKRVDSKNATLADIEGQWIFKDAFVSYETGKTVEMPEYSLPTSLTVDDIEESFSSPETMSFWRLPEFIKTVENAGFDATELRVHFQTLSARPLFFAAMIFIAASVSMTSPRERGNLKIIVAGIISGFILFFVTSYLQALGISGQIPASMSAWTAPCIALLTGAWIMLSKEDG